jgi:hypothetical protein
VTTAQQAPAGAGGTAAPASSTTSDVPWGWIIVAAAVVIGIAGVVIARRQRTRRRGLAAWRADAASALERARIASDLLRDGTTRDRTATQAVGRQVEDAARRLDAVAARASIDDDRQAATATAAALRDLYYAREADDLVHESHAPTAEELARAGRSRASRLTDLDRAMDHLAMRAGTRTPSSTGL